MGAADFPDGAVEAVAIRLQPGADKAVEMTGADAVIAQFQRPPATGEPHVVRRPVFMDEGLDPLALFVGKIRVEKRPDVVAAEARLLFDQEEAEVGPPLGEGESAQATAQPASGYDQLQRRCAHARTAAVTGMAVPAGDRYDRPR